jgi:hypothetical protein
MALEMPAKRCGDTLVAKYTATQCDNARCTSKGKRVKVRRKLSAPMVLVQSFNTAPQGFGKKHPRFFVREIHKGSSWKYQKLKSLPLPQRPLQPQKITH